MKAFKNKLHHVCIKVKSFSRAHQCVQANISIFDNAHWSTLWKRVVLVSYSFIEHLSAQCGVLKKDLGWKLERWILIPSWRWADGGALSAGSKSGFEGIPVIRYSTARSGLLKLALNACSTWSKWTFIECQY